MLFVQEGGKVVMRNASLDALAEVQKVFRGTADELEIKDEHGVVDMVKEIRAERRDDYQSK